MSNNNDGNGNDGNENDDKDNVIHLDEVRKEKEKQRLTHNVSYIVYNILHELLEPERSFVMKILGDGEKITQIANFFRGTKKLLNNEFKDSIKLFDEVLSIPKLNITFLVFTYFFRGMAKYNLGLNSKAKSDFLDAALLSQDKKGLGGELEDGGIINILAVIFINRIDRKVPADAFE